MKVLVLQSELGCLRGGGENFTRNLFTAFAERGHRVAAAFVASRNGKYPIALPPSIDPIPIPGYWSRNLGQGALSSMRRYIPFRNGLGVKWDRLQEGVSWRIIRWHDRRFEKRIERDFGPICRNFDVVYVHGSARLASKIAQYRPTILRLPGPVTAEMEPVLRAVHAVCANGDALIRIRGFLGDHAIELPIGVDRRRFSPAGASVRTALGWKNQNRVVGYVGRLTHLKGADILAAAFREISSVNPDARLLVIGSGTEETFIRSVLAKELSRGIVHMERDVEHEELPDWYRAMNLLLMPSRYENFSNSILEAMACGIPFLASDIGGSRSLSATGAGWFFEPASVSSLASSMRKILEDSPEMKARGAMASNYARECCTWEASANRLEEIVFSRLGLRA